MIRLSTVLTVVFALFLLNAGTAQAANAVLTWAANTETDLAGYKVYRGVLGADCSASGPLQPLMKGSPTAPVALGKVTTYTDAGLPAMDGTLCYEITAYDTSNNESTRSLRVSKTVNLVPPAAPTGLSVVVQ